jgi:hypothetical protein
LTITTSGAAHAGKSDVLDAIGAPFSFVDRRSGARL